MKRLVPFVVLLLAGGASHSLAATPRQQTASALKNAATAEESYRVDHDAYTESVRALRDEGLEWNRDKIKLFISWATKTGYCVHAKHDNMRRPMHYDSSEGEPKRGPCPATEDAERRWRDQMDNLLKNAATAQESYATEHDGEYTTSKEDLRDEGWKNPWREIRLIIARVEEGYYCMEAHHRGLDVGHHYQSTKGRPVRGGCPS